MQVVSDCRKLPVRQPRAPFPSPLVWTPLVYIILSLCLLRPFQYVMYKDEVCYIAMAEHYARGEFLSGLNALWSPLLSWLLAVPLWLGLPTALAAKLLNIAIGAFTVLSAQLLFKRLRLTLLLRVCLSVPVIVFVLYYSLAWFSPDLLLTGLLNIYFALLLSRRCPQNVYASMVAGIIGALAYLCKAYAFYFFFCHFLLVTGICVLLAASGRERKVLVRNWAAGTLVFLSLASMWMYALHSKYPDVTVGVAGKYNYAIVGPDSPGRPLSYVGLLPPHPSTTTSIWEQPYYLLPWVKPWSPFDSTRAFIHQLRIINDNFRITVSAYTQFSMLWAAIVLTGLLTCLQQESRSARLKLLLALVTFVVYPAGYLLVHTEERYLLPMAFLLLSVGGQFIQILWFKHWLALHTRVVLVVLFITSFSVNPIFELARRANLGRTTEELARMVDRRGLRGARIASDSDDSATTCIAYRVGAKYYGMPKKPSNLASTVAELRQNAIEFYFVWDGAEVAIDGLALVEEFRAGNRELSIYAVKLPDSAD